MVIGNPEAPTLVAPTEVTNRTTEITVEMGGVVNNLGAGDDIDGIVEVFTDRMCEAIAVGVEGVHE